MATTKTAKPNAKEKAAEENRVSLRALLSDKATVKRFDTWIVGETPLIVHSWSEKAKKEMLQKQAKAVKGDGKAPRDPRGDFVNSLYEIGDGEYGFPTTALKLAMVEAAHKDKGITKVSVKNSLWLDCRMVKTRPALAGAVCNMPLSRVWGSKPEMREDMVRVGAGLNKKSSLAYRGQFWPWAIKVSGRFNPTQLPAESLAFLLDEAGRSSGIGEWRNEKNGVFGSFRMATEEEEKAWDAFAAGKGPLPHPEGYFAEAAE